MKHQACGQQRQEARTERHAVAGAAALEEPDEGARRQQEQQHAAEAAVAAALRHHRLAIAVPADGRSGFYMPVALSLLECQLTRLASYLANQNTQARKRCACSFNRDSVVRGRLVKTAKHAARSAVLVTQH